MRPTQNRRMRGRSRSKGPNPLTRSYESNGPDVKVRGTAQHVADKYGQLARDAQASGDPVAAEAYFQHAEHYYRIIAAAQEALRQQYGGTRSFDEDGDEGDDDSNGFSYHSHERGGQERGGQERHDRGGNGAADDYDPGSQPQPQFQPNAYEQRGDRQERGERHDRSQERGFAPRGERQDRGDRPPRGDRRERFQRPPMEQRMPADARRDPRDDPDFAPRRQDQPRRDEQPRREELRADEQPRIDEQPHAAAPAKPARAPRTRRRVEEAEQPALPDFLMKPVSRPAPAEAEAPAPSLSEGEAPKPKRRRTTRRVEKGDEAPASTDKSAAE